MIAEVGRELVIVDASLAVQLVIEEPDSVLVDEYLFDRRRADRLLAPTILASEVAAAITKKLRRREIGLSAAKAAFASLGDALFSGAIELLPANDFLDAAFDLSIRLHHPLHDCLYLAAADKWAAVLATRDATLAAKARAAGIEAEFVE